MKRFAMIAILWTAHIAYAQDTPTNRMFGSVFSAVRLDNGNRLIGHIDQITEFNPRGKAVWKFTNQDIEEVVISAMCNVHVLPNGHIAVGTYHTYDKEGQGNGLLEISRDKELVWRYSDPKADKNLMGIQVLDANGQAFSEQPLR